MKLTKKDKRTKLDKQIDMVLDEMECELPATQKYSAMADNLNKLYEAKAKVKTKPGISIDTIAIVAGNLLGILLILQYEKINAVTSKALGFVLRGRV